MYSPNKSVQNRVSKQLSKFNDPEACWIWPMSKTKAGYGQLSTSNGSAQRRELHYAHRVAHHLSNGPIPDGMFVCHKCDNPSCFNPNHLFLGTQKDNVADCISKGRARGAKDHFFGDAHWTRAHPEKKKAVMCGENHFRSKLTEEAVSDIRESSEKGVTLAEKYGVTQSLVSAVRRGKIWRSI